MNIVVMIFLCLSLLSTISLIFSHNKRQDIIKKYTNLRNIVENIKLYNNLFETKCNIVYPIFFINMDKHTERRKYMESQLNKISTDFHRIKGFNGYKIENKQQYTVEGIKFNNFYPFKSLSLCHY